MKTKTNYDEALIKRLQKTRLFAGMAASEVEEVVRHIGEGGENFFDFCDY